MRSSWGVGVAITPLRWIAKLAALYPDMEEGLALAFLIAGLVLAGYYYTPVAIGVGVWAAVACVVGVIFAVRFEQPGRSRVKRPW